MVSTFSRLNEIHFRGERAADAAINLHEAKTHVSRLVVQAVAGMGFVICKAWVPLVQVGTCLADGESLDMPPQAPARPAGRAVFGSR